MANEHELCERAFRFACEITKLCVRLQERGPVVRRLSIKLLDSGTSIGANLEEGLSLSLTAPRETRIESFPRLRSFRRCTHRERVGPNRPPRGASASRLHLHEWSSPPEHSAGNRYARADE